MEKRIKKYPCRVLRKKARPVSDLDSARGLIKRLKETLKNEDGVGLAANQIGEEKRIIAIKDEEGIYILINPEIVFSQGSLEIEEGCLSVPGVYANIERAEEIEVEALDENGEKVSLRMRGVPAIIVQHEIDHLDGKLFVDKLPFKKRLGLLFNYFLKKDGKR